MRWFALSIGILLVVAGLYLPITGSAWESLVVQADPQTQRVTTSGAIIGGVSPNGAQAWLGIPYAAAPVGNRRWRAPLPVSPWRAPRETVRFSSVCPQYAGIFSTSGAEPGTLLGDEDCLFLNVFAPRGVDERASLPVMVFVHGGGNTIGSAIPYDGSAFVQEQGVVMVTLNYRLGPLGWFSHASLRGGAETPEEASGNFALLDIVAALQWVQRNVRNFGGDPQRVTVFGESAGGRNVYGLLATPLAKDLFHGAIIQSGSPGTFTRLRAESPASDPQPGHPNSSHELLLDWLQGSDGQSRELASATLQRLPESELPVFLRGLTLEQLMAPLYSEAGMYATPQLFRDGLVLPEDPLPEVFKDPQRWNRVPLLVGSNRDEMKLFLATSEEHASKRFGLVPAPRDEQTYELLAKYHSDAWKAAGVDLPLAAISASQGDAALYAYRFDWDAMRSDWLIDLPVLLGASHAVELDFLFGPLLSRVVPGMFYAGNKPGREALGRAMRDYWAGFAYVGRPGSGRSASQTAWPRWNHDKPLVMILDEPADGGLRPQRLSVSTADVKARLQEETGLGDRMRCAIYVDSFLDNNGMSELFDSREYRELGCGQFPAWSLAGWSR